MGLIFFLSLICVADGQVKLSTVSGSVIDQVAAVLPGVQVSLKGNTDKERIQKTTTNSDGNFIFTDVPPGDYEIEVKIGYINRSFRKQINVTSSSQSSQLQIAISLEPCGDENVSDNSSQLTDSDRAAITRETIALRFPNIAARDQTNFPKLIFSNENIETAWLSPELKERVSVMSRIKIQDITDTTGEFMYYSVSTMSKRGNCVSIELFDNWTVKGQLENANMAGGGRSYEFRKVNGQWKGTAFMSWVH